MPSVAVTSPTSRRPDTRCLMSDQPSHGRVAHVTAFVTAGVVTTAQELASEVLRDIERADPSTVAEETLCLVAVSSARAVRIGDEAAADSVASATENLPFLYRDYILGGAIIEDPDRAIDADQSIYERLERIRSFYAAHFPPGQFPGPRAVDDKMALWMGRISPPRLEELPVDRLARLQLSRRLNTHLQLVLEFVRQSAGTTVATNG